MVSATPARTETHEARPPDEMREFLLVLRRACLLIVDYVERRYGLSRCPNSDAR